MLLRGVHHVDRLLSVEVVEKEALQLVGAVALLVASNAFCKLPMQDGEHVPGERGLATAEDIVYWTDNTYSIAEVLDMETKMQYGLELGGYESPLQFLATYCAMVPQPEPTVAIAQELIVKCAREYALLKLHPRLLAACCLRIAVRNGPSAANDDALMSFCGYAPEVRAPARGAPCARRMHRPRSRPRAGADGAHCPAPAIHGGARVEFSLSYFRRAGQCDDPGPFLGAVLRDSRRRSYRRNRNRNRKKRATPSFLRGRRPCPEQTDTWPCGAGPGPDGGAGARGAPARACLRCSNSRGIVAALPIKVTGGRRKMPAAWPAATSASTVARVVRASS